MRIRQRPQVLRICLAVRSAISYLRRNKAKTLSAVVAAGLGAAVLGASLVLANSARAGVQQQFLKLRSSRVVVTNISGETGWASDEQLAHTAALPGVKSVCRAFQSATSPSVSRGLWYSSDLQATVVAGTPGCRDSLGLVISQGRDFEPHERRDAAPVAILGSSVAHALGISTLSGDNQIRIGRLPFSVIGIYGQTPNSDIQSTLAVYLPSKQAADGVGVPFDAEQVVVDAESAAVDVVSARLALSLEPGDPDGLFVLVGAIPTGLQSAISVQLTLLLSALGGISVLVGLFVIANQTLQSVGMRRSEIALRRALGQPKSVVVVQILVETSIVGCAGALFGSVTGQLVAGAVAISQGWPVMASLWLVPVSAALGLLIGAVAGAYPAGAASATSPAEALKSV